MIQNDITKIVDFIKVMSHGNAKFFMYFNKIASKKKRSEINKILNEFILEKERKIYY